MTIVLALILAPLMLLTLGFAIEVAVGLRPARLVLPAVQVRPQCVVIVPAHDEEPILSMSLLSLKDAAADVARILVVADNCGDSTSSIAQKLGVEVIERFDEDRRGKGFALDFARRHLERDPPDIVVIVDADCRIDGTSLEALIAACLASGRPCQATNLQKPALDGPPTVQLSTFAFFLKNVIRQRALQRLAGRAHLLGTGMALPWLIFEQAELATSDLVEDLKLGQQLAKAGHPALFFEQATVWSNAETPANALSQRRRWEGGFLANALRAGPRMMAHSLCRLDLGGIWAAVDTMIPPLALLFLVDFAALISSGVWIWLTDARPWPAVLLTGTIILSGAAVLCSWLAGGSRFVRFGGLLRVPLYVVWKFPMYLGFARQGAPKEWVRTSRD